MDTHCKLSRKLYDLMLGVNWNLKKAIILLTSPVQQWHDDGWETSEEELRCCSISSTFINYLPNYLSSFIPELRGQVKNGVSDHGLVILNDGLVLLKFKDAIREGDSSTLLKDTAAAATP